MKNKHTQGQCLLKIQEVYYQPGVGMLVQLEMSPVPESPHADLPKAKTVFMPVRFEGSDVLDHFPNDYDKNELIQLRPLP